MKRTLIRKTFLIIAIVLASAFVILRSPLRLGLDLRGGISLILRVKVDDASPTQQREVVAQTREILERRINAFGLSEAPVQPYGSRGNELLVQLPGITDHSRIKNLLQSRGVLEWYSVADGPFTSMEDALAQHGGIVPFNHKLLATKPAAGHGPIWFLLSSPPVVRGTDLRDARVAADAMDQPVTAFTLRQDAATRFEQYTRTHIGQRSAIVIDEEILSVPVIEDVIRDSGQIRGAHSREEAEDLAVNLRPVHFPLPSKSCRRGLSKHLSAPTPSITACWRARPDWRRWLQPCSFTTAGPEGTQPLHCS